MRLTRFHPDTLSWGRCGAARSVFRAIHPARAQALLLDITDFAAIGPAVAKLESEVGPIDVLVNNAGYGHEGILEESLVGLNKTTVRRKRIRRGRNDEGCAAVHARETRRHIVNITSMAGYVGIAHYARSMLAVECIFEALAKEVRHLGIRVTAIAPGSFRTDWAGFGARGA